VGRGLVLILVDLPTDDGGYDVGDDIRMPVHVRLAPRLRTAPLTASSAIGSSSETTKSSVLYCGAANDANDAVDGSSTGT
jgi:hypothetical protein